MLSRALPRLPSVLASRLLVLNSGGMAPKRRAKSAQAAAQEPPAQDAQQPAAKRQRGARGKAAKAAAPPSVAAAAPAAAAGLQQQQQQQQFFLMKSEPDVFSIDDLEARPNQTEPWDGVRSHQAKKVLQSMRVGDQALFYHSNAKPPGVVGVVEVVREAYPDPSQFDSSSDYYDAGSTPDAPKWVCVDVQLRRKLGRQLSLEELKAHSSGSLAGMALFKYGRLSVQPVTAAEWEFVLGLEAAPAPRTR